MDENKTMILTMQYGDGSIGKRELLSIFQADNGRDYAALLPLNDDETPQEGASVELVRVKQYENEDLEEDYLIEGIGTDEEFQTAREAFERLGFVEVEDVAELDESELPTLTFETDDGKMQDWAVIDVFDHRDRKYIALIPVSDIEDGDGSIGIHLMRLALTERDGMEGCEVSAIPSDMEYEDVARVFEQRIGAESGE